MFDRVIMAACTVVMLCLFVLLAYQFRPRQALVVDEIYAPLAIPECNDGARLVSEESDGIAVSSCEPLDAEAELRAITLEGEAY